MCTYKCLLNRTVHLPCYRYEALIHGISPNRLEYVVTSASLTARCTSRAALTNPQYYIHWSHYTTHLSIEMQDLNAQGELIQPQCI